MKRRVRGAAGLLVAVLAAVPASAGPCRRVNVVDRAGEPVNGIEDLGYDAAARRLYLSAHDRRAVRAAAATGEAAPDGGIHTVPLTRLRAAGAGARVTAPERTRGVPGPFQPHGLALTRAPGGALHVVTVNQRWTGGEPTWRLAHFTAGAGGALRHAGSLDHPALCSTNDVAAAGPDTVYVTRTHGACGGLDRAAETVFALGRGAVLRADLGTGTVRPVVGGLLYANGVALSPSGGRLAVAETRAGRVRVYETGAWARGPRRVIEVPGGPDNLSWPRPDRLLTAAHPDLLRLGLARGKLFGVTRAPTRVVALDPRRGEVRTLARGDALNAGTAVVRAGPVRVASGVLDHGLWVCPAGPPPLSSRPAPR